MDQFLTQKVALLARLELTQREIQEFTLQLKDVLHYVEKINEVSVQGIEPTTHPFSYSTPLRADEVMSSVDGLLESAPELVGRGYKVPQVLSI